MKIGLIAKYQLAFVGLILCTVGQLKAEFSFETIESVFSLLETTHKGEEQASDVVDDVLGKKETNPNSAPNGSTSAQEVAVHKHFHSIIEDYMKKMSHIGASIKDKLSGLEKILEKFKEKLTQIIPHKEEENQVKKHQHIIDEIHDSLTNLQDSIDKRLSTEQQIDEIVKRVTTIDKYIGRILLAITAISIIGGGLSLAAHILPVAGNIAGIALAAAIVSVVATACGVITKGCQKLAMLQVALEEINPADIKDKEVRKKFESARKLLEKIRKARENTAQRAQKIHTTLQAKKVQLEAFVKRVSDNMKGIQDSVSHGMDELAREARNMLGLNQEKMSLVTRKIEQARSKINDMMSARRHNPNARDEAYDDDQEMVEIKPQAGESPSPEALAKKASSNDLIGNQSAVVQ